MQGRRTSIIKRLRGGFTLLEILIVGALISLFSGLAIFAVQEMYDSNRRKVMFNEAAAIGTVLSFAHDDIGFFPRLHLVGRPVEMLHLAGATPSVIIPHFDTYGAHSATFRAQHVIDNWKGPYGAKSTTRLSQGQRSFVQMRLMDIQTVNMASQFEPLGIDLTLVNWPADTWSNPWMLYRVAVENVGGDIRLRLAMPGERGDFLNAVVSYGRNGIPGGNHRTAVDEPDYFLFQRDQASLFVEGDLAGGEAQYTLKSRNPTNNQLLLGDAFNNALRESLNHPNPDPDTGRVGVLDEGSDDIVWIF